MPPTSRLGTLVQINSESEPDWKEGLGTPSSMGVIRTRPSFVARVINTIK